MMTIGKRLDYRTVDGLPLLLLRGSHSDTKEEASGASEMLLNNQQTERAKAYSNP
jgi:hypothetical protein